jgi:mannose-6-phosphate isomerase-like protein (cupin superfamily)
MTLINSGDTKPLLVRAAEAETLGIAPDTMHLLADGDPTDGAVSVSRTKMGKDTEGASPHYHSRAAESFLIISGGLHVLTGEQVVTAREGDFLLVPPNTTHAFRTPADTGVDLLFFMPGVARFEYFRLIGRIRSGEASPQEILDTQERFDNHFQDSAIWQRFRDVR